MAKPSDPPPEIAILHAANAQRAADSIGRPLATLGDLAELSERHGYRQVAVHADALALFDLPRPPYSRAAGRTHPFLEAPGRRVVPTPDQLTSFYTLRRSRSTKSPWLDVFIPTYDDDAGLGDLAPADLLSSLTSYRDALGTPYRFSPGHTGTRLMLSAHKGALGPSTAHPVEPAIEGGTEADFHYTREPTDDERRMGYVHAYDARARYLATCSALQLGLGEPDERTGVVGFELVPGYWHADLREPPPGPDPFRGVRHGWVSTPTAYLALQLGCLGAIDRAYVWPHHERALRPWYSRVSRALKELQGPAHGPERLLLKRTYTIAIGWLAGHWARPGDVLHRPDWRHAIIAQSRANLYRRIANAHVDPLAIDVDCVYVPSHSPDPLASSEVYLSLVGRELGAFRVVGSGKLGDALDAISSGTEPVEAYRSAIA